MKVVYFGVSGSVYARVRRILSDRKKGNRDRVVEKMGVGKEGLDAWIEAFCERDVFEGKVRAIARSYVEKGWTVYGVYLEASMDVVEVGSGMGDWEWWVDLGKELLLLGASKGELREWVKGKIEQVENQRAHARSQE